jgi:membrane protein implicated in regulation of membrane protease activity
METSQIIFSVALGSITLLITFFAVYVIWSTMWADRWVRTRPRKDK